MNFKSWIQIASPSRIVIIAMILSVMLRGAMPAWGQESGNEDPFGSSQMEESTISGTPQGGVGIRGLTVSGFVDTGYIHISQEGPKAPGGNVSWAYGNTQFTYFSETSTFTVNEVDLTLDVEREVGGKLIGARASLDVYPSRDTEAYTLPQKTEDVDQAFVFFQVGETWTTRMVMGRAPGFVTMAQWETDAPRSRLIGHTYVFQAGGGYPYGLQVITRPNAAWALKLGASNGGVGDYSFFPGDDSTLNRPTARDEDNGSNTDKASGLTGSAALQWTPFDQPAGAGTLILGLAGARNSALTYDSTNQKVMPYAFDNVYLAYRIGPVEARIESASLEAFYEQSLGRVEMSMTYLLLSWFIGVDHTVTLRGEKMEFLTDRYWSQGGEATKSGLTYRYRVADPMVIKLEAVREVQTPQFYNPNLWTELTTDVAAMSWVMSF